MSAPLTVSPTSTPPKATPGKAHPHRLRHELEGAGLGGLTVAAGFGGARKFTSNAGYVKKMTKEGTLVHAGPKVHSAAHPHVADLARMKGGRKAKLQHLIDHPDVQARLHEDLRSHTPSKEALHVSNLMHPNGYTNTQIAHSRGKFNRDLLHDPVAGDMHHRVAATKAMIGSSNPAHTHEIHRGMRGVEHEVGDTVHFGHFSSFTSTKPIAEAYAKQKHAKPGVYTIPRGKAKAMPVDGTGWASRNHEWLAGGEHRVTSKKLVTDSKGNSYHHYTVEPVNSSGVSKASPSMDESWGGAQGPRAWFKHGYQGGASYKGRSATTRAHFETGRKAVAGKLSRTEGAAFNAGHYTSRAVSEARTPKGAAVAGGVALGTGALALRHRKKDGAVAKSDPFGITKRDSEDARMRTRVIRGGPYTSRNRKQLRHHAAVGAGLGASVGAAGGAHLGGLVHGEAVKLAQQERMGGKVPGRAGMALRGAALVGVLGAGAGAQAGSNVAAASRHNDRKRAQARHELRHEVGKAAAIEGKIIPAIRKPGRLREFRRGLKGTVKGEARVDQAAQTPKVHMHETRDAWGYPKKTRVYAPGGHGPDAREALKAETRKHSMHGPHQGSFKAGVKTGQAVAGARRRPEYAISVPAVAAGAGVVHHEVKGNKNTKEKTVAKSAFGVEISKDDGPSAKRGAKRGAIVGGVIGAVDTAGAHGAAHANLKAVTGRSASAGEHLRLLPKTASARVLPGAALGAGIGAIAGHQAKKKRDKAAAARETVGKYDRGTITYHHEQAGLHSRKKQSGGRQASGGAAAATAGVAAYANRGRIGREVADRTVKIPGTLEHITRARNAERVAGRGGAALAVGGAGVAAVGAARWAHHGRKQNKSANAAQHARLSRNASMSKSAFGVEDDRLEKSFLTAGLDAAKGARRGLTGVVGAERTGAAANGKAAAAWTKGKVVPIANKMTATKPRVATLAGGAGLGTGLALSDKKNN